MKKSEVCYIDQTVIKNPGIGKKTCALQALLLTPKGTSVIGQTEGFREDDYKERD